MRRARAGATGREGRYVSKEGQGLSLSELARLDPDPRRTILLPTEQGKVPRRTGGRGWGHPTSLCLQQVTSAPWPGTGCSLCLKCSSHRHPLKCHLLGEAPQHFLALSFFNLILHTQYYLTHRYLFILSVSPTRISFHEDFLSILSTEVSSMPRKRAWHTVGSRCSLYIC